MVPLNRAQRLALKRVFDRHPLYPRGTVRDVFTGELKPRGVKPLTYRQFRRTVEPGPGCVMVHWCGMWLGIEPDGYTHS